MLMEQPPDTCANPETVIQMQILIFDSQKVLPGGVPLRIELFDSADEIPAVPIYEILSAHSFAFMLCLEIPELIFFEDIRVHLLDHNELLLIPGVDRLENIEPAPDGMPISVAPRVRREH